MIPAAQQGQGQGMGCHGMGLVPTPPRWELSLKVSARSLGFCAAPDIAARVSHLSFCSRWNLLLCHGRPRGRPAPQLWWSSWELLPPHSLVNPVIL